jgi:hypothetical protein
MHATMRRAIVTALLALACLAGGPAAAEASSRQFSIVQDDVAFRGFLGDPDRWFAETSPLGAEMVRFNLIWRDVAPGARSTRRPSGHVPGDPASGYNWSEYDRAVNLARRHGLRVMLVPTGPVPYWASDDPRRCARARRKNFCNYRPDAKQFGQFVKAAARRYRGRVRIWSVWNEPNLSSWLSPQVRRTRHGKARWSGRMYRALWYQAWKAIAKYDRPRRGSVLFGETAATHSPIILLRSALCLDPHGRPYRGRRRLAQGCPRRPKRLSVAGIAHHPYNQAATGSPRSRTGSRYSAPLAYTYRLHSLISLAAKYRRIKRKPIYMTEHGFQSRPPDRFGARPWTQARYLNESDRLFFGDPWVRSVAQYELVDEKEVSSFNTGLRYWNGLKKKPAWPSYRLSVVVTRLSSRSVEVWGEARPARGRTTVSVYAYSKSRKRYLRVARARANPRGIFRKRVRRGSASRLRYQLRWRDASGKVVFSRPAHAGPRLRYRR